MDIRTCSKCPAEIFFGETRSGARNPIDAEPADNGNVRITERKFGPPYADALSPIEALAAQNSGETLYVSHFVTCPEAASFRRKGARRG